MNESVPPRTRRTRIWIIAGSLVICAILGLVLWSSWETPEAMVKRGLTLARRNPPASEDLFRRALRARGGRFPDAQLALAWQLVRRGELREMRELLSDLDLVHCQPGLLLEFGEAAVTEAPQEAFRALEVAATLPTTEGEKALKLLRSHYEEWGLAQEAIHAARRLTSFSANDPEPWIALIQMLVRMSRDAECVAAIRDSKSQFLPTQFGLESRNVLVSRYINLGDAAAARKVLNDLRKDEGDSLRVRHHEVFVSRLEGNLQHALEVSDGMVQEVPDQPQAYFARGVVLLDLRQFDRASADLQRVIAAEPANVAALFKLSEACRNLGQTEPAKEYRDRATALSTKLKRIGELQQRRQTESMNPEIYDELTQLAIALGDQPNAMKWRAWAERLRAAP